MDNHSQVKSSVGKEDHVMTSALALALVGEAIAPFQEILAAAPSSTINGFFGQPFPRKRPSRRDRRSGGAIGLAGQAAKLTASWASAALGRRPGAARASIRYPSAGADPRELPPPRRSARPEERPDRA
jgi:hypothetical protein